MTIEITFADISYHLEQGDLQEWGEKLRALEKAQQLAGADMIEYVPVKYGRWVNGAMFGVEFIDGDDEAYICSECSEVHNWKAKYCPNCGARMDGDENA